MALFGNKQKKEKKVETPKSTSKAKPLSKITKTKEVKTPSRELATINNTDSSLSPTNMILRPHITEKSGSLSQIGKYTFQITKDANKQSISRAIKVLYKITPKHVNLLNQPSRNVFVRGRRGVVPGIRKAIVTVKKGDTIDFV